MSRRLGVCGSVIFHHQAWASSAQSCQWRSLETHGSRLVCHSGHVALRQGQLHRVNKCQTYGFSTLGSPNPTHLLPGMAKRWRKLALAQGSQSGFRPQPQEESAQ